MSFIRDIFSESGKDGQRGKWSSKRTMGIITGVAGIVATLAAGLHWYDISSDLINPIWAYSGTMLGISVLGGIGNKTSS